MEKNLGKKQIKRSKSEDTDTLYKIQNKSTFTTSKYGGYFDCLALRNQTVFFEKSTHEECCLLEISKFHLNKSFLQKFKIKP